MRYVAISGSLRSASTNSALLRVFAKLAPAGVEFHVFQRIAKLPLFNPDLEDSLPSEVDAFRSVVGHADALVIASPEYAHGITGAMKNALDWLVSCEGFVGMPVAVLNAAPRAHHADAALREVLRTMSARIAEDASVSIPQALSGLSEVELAESIEMQSIVVAALLALETAIRGDQHGPSLPVS